MYTVTQRVKLRTIESTFRLLDAIQVQRILRTLEEEKVCM